MVELCLEGEPRMSVSNIEVTRGGISYSVDTLAEFHAAQPADYWFLMGSDALLTLMTWKHPEKLMKLCRLGVALRAPEHKVLCSKNLPEWVLEKIDWVERPFSAISSTSVRDKIFRDQDVSQWLKPEVLQYIQEKKLYRK
jgi:nicotinate-nucleotide adenylyltransferase